MNLGWKTLPFIDTISGVVAHNVLWLIMPMPSILSDTKHANWLSDLHLGRKTPRKWMWYTGFDTKNCQERPPVLGDQVFLAEVPTFQCTGNWTCHQRPPVLRPHFYAQLGGLSRQVPLYDASKPGETQARFTLQVFFGHSDRKWPKPCGPCEKSSLIWPTPGIIYRK